MSKNKNNLIYFYTLARLQAEVLKNYIGYFWWVLDPALSVGIYYIVFKLIFNRGGEDYIPYLIVGIVVWKWFQNTIAKGSMSIYDQKGLYNKIYLPKDIFPWIEISFHTVKFFIIFFVLLLIFPLIGYPIGKKHIYLPVVIVAQFIFSLGIITLLSSVTPFFPDAKMFINHLLRLSFYPSGVIFDITRVPEKYKPLVDYNPMAQSIMNFRNIIMYSKEPSLFSLLYLTGIGLTTFLLGMLLIRKYDGQYAKLI